jgi:predicted HTH domain antitoxin
MPLTISDEVLQQAGMDERSALVEIACRLFDAGKLSLPLAARMAGLSRGEMEDELLDRNIAIYRLTTEDYEEDLSTMARLRGEPQDGGRI